jgi:hypothetical protein
MAIWVNCNFTVNIGDKSTELTREEAMQLYHSLRNVLDIFENNIHSEFPWQTGVGDTPAFVSPDIGKFEITC